MKLLPIVFGLLTAVFWGLYGPVLADARKILGSPFKPYMLIGLAYLLWGIGGGVVGMLQKGDNWNFPREGTTWGFIAGSLGAFGALTLTLAMYYQGKPFIVMPIVFGGAVTVSALVSVWKERGHTEINPLLYLGILGVVVSAALVAYCTPHAAPSGAKPAGEASKGASSAPTKPA